MFIHLGYSEYVAWATNVNMNAFFFIDGVVVLHSVPNF